MKGILLTLLKELLLRRAVATYLTILAAAHQQITAAQLT